MALEGQGVAAFVWTTLMADAGPGGVSTLLGGRIYRDQIPQSATLPAAFVFCVSGTPAETLGGVRVVARVLIDVHLVAAGTSYGPINPAAARVDALLQERSGVHDGVVVVKIGRLQELPYPENEAGVGYRHLNLPFKTLAYAAP